MKKKIMSIALCAVMVVSLASGVVYALPEAEPEYGKIELDTSRYTKPEITPPEDHPRLLIRKSDVDALKVNVDLPVNAAAKASWEEAKKLDVKDGVLPENLGGGNYSPNAVKAIESLAFDYVVFGNVQSGELAKKYLMNMLSTLDLKGSFGMTREGGHAIFTASEVYDWCYPLLSDEEKQFIITKCEEIATPLEAGYPPTRLAPVAGHGGEAIIMRDLLSFGIATYNEKPDIYNFVAGRIFDEFVEPINFWAPSHSHHQGSAYGIYRWGWTLWLDMIYEKMTGNGVLDDEVAKIGYEYLYLRRPDGQNLRLGDDYNEDGKPNEYWNSYATPLALAANLYGDAYFAREAQIETKNAQITNGGGEGFYSPVVQMIVTDPSLTYKPMAELPLAKYFGSPNGMMIARTGWNMGTDAPDVLALMKFGEKWGGNHDHLDAGTFQLYYKGALASESGYYESYGTVHDIGYNKKTAAHNTILVHDPDETNPTKNTNDDGQRYPSGSWDPQSIEDWKRDEFTRAEVIGHEFGPDSQNPEYTYLAGDMTTAYRDKISEALRSMLFINTGDADHPGVMVVMDKVVTSNKDFKKSWMLHMQEEPTVDGAKSVITRTEGSYNGRMVLETLLPKNSEITKLGGKEQEFMVCGENMPLRASIKADAAVEEGWGRIEVSPKDANTEDYFLNVMTVSDADTTAADYVSTLIEGDTFYGAEFGDYAAVFAKDSKTRISDTLSFTVEGEGDVKVFVGGLKAGTWSINSASTQVATEDGGCIWFTAPRGKITLEYAGDKADKEFSVSAPKPHTDVLVQIGGQFIYSDVPARIIDERTLIPLRAVSEALGAKVDYDEATETATVDINNNILKITKDSKIAYFNGEAKELDVSAMIIEDRFVVPIRFVSECFNADVYWGDRARVVYIKPGIVRPVVTKQDGYAFIKESKASECSQEFFDWKAWDNDKTTLWSAHGEHYIDFEFDTEYTIDAVELMLNQNNKRNALFEILYSTDGENFTSLHDGAADGTVGNYFWEVFEFEPVKAKYFRYIAKGSNLSQWNGLQEIRFREAK